MRGMHLQNHQGLGRRAMETKPQTRGQLGGGLFGESANEKLKEEKEKEN